MPLTDAIAGFLKIVFGWVQPNDPAVALEPGELLFGELADGNGELKPQVVERAQFTAEIARDETVLQTECIQPGVGHSAGAETGDLVDHAAGQALLQAPFNSRFKDFARPG